MGGLVAEYKLKLSIELQRYQLISSSDTKWLLKFFRKGLVESAVKLKIETKNVHLLASTQCREIVSQDTRIKTLFFWKNLHFKASSIESKELPNI